MGPDVHLGSRISAASWGAQIVVSSASAGLSSGLEDITLRSLGHHTLKDIEKRTELFQVMAPGLTEDFPALRTKGTHPTNLPPRPASLIGRQQDLAALEELLGSPQTSVVTLTGPGGTGKTSLAAALGAQLLSSFADGVFFVDLSALNDPSLVIPALAQALALKETPGSTLQQSLIEHLAAKDMLVILDNFEQVITAAPEVSSVLTEAPSLKLLITSREALRIQGERVVSLAPLELPSPEHDDVDEVARSAAVALFTERARAVKQDFTLTADNAAEVAAICRRLDGLPLALELAAARINLLSPSALLARLDHGLKLLTSGRRDASQRQKTLKGAIAWSYGLLSKDEQRLFYRLGVFAGGWSLEAAEQVCDRGDLTTDVLDGLASLVDKSLVRAAGQQGRFTMLETIREFALEKLEESGKAAEIRRAHAEFFARLAEEAEPYLVGVEQQEWLDLLEKELANVRNAFHWWSRRSGERLATAVVALRRFWWSRGYLSEGRRWLETSISSGGDHPDDVRAKVLYALSFLAQAQGDVARASVCGQEALTLYKHLKDSRGVARASETLAMLAEEGGDLARARILYETSLATWRTLGDKRGVSVSTANLGNLALLSGDYPRAIELHNQSLALADEMGDTEGIATDLCNLALAHLFLGRPDEAVGFFKKSLGLAQQLRHTVLTIDVLIGLGASAAAFDESARALRIIGAADKLCEATATSLSSLERRLRERTIRLLAATLDDVAVEHGLKKGVLLSIEDAFSEAGRVAETSGYDS